MITCVQSHVFRQLSQPRFDFIQDFRKRGDVVDIGRFDMHVDDDVSFAVYGAMFTVMESVRLAFPALLTAFRIGCALHLLYAAAAWRIVVPVEGFLLQHLSVPVDLCVQFFQICLRRFFDDHKLLFVLVCFRLDVR